MLRLLRIYFIAFICLAWTTTLAQPSIHEVKLLNTVVRQYEKAEWNITVEGSFLNPYDQKEVALDLLLTTPSGKPLLLPCYFEKGQLWKARFSAQQTGTYTAIFRLTTQGKTFQTSPASFSAQASGKKGFLHKNDHWTFRFDNGALFRGIGENVAWESRSFEKDKWTYDYLLPTLSNNGANFFRTWMCYWNIPLEWKKVNATRRYSNTSEYFHPQAIGRMDTLLQLCDSLDLYFMLSLEWHGHLMRGGGWNSSNYNVVNGGPAKDPTEFFTLPAAADKYKNKLRYVVARWGYSPRIAVWEFFNEIDNAAFSREDSTLIPPTAIAQWHLEMSRYLKDIDPYGHLVSTSISHRDIMGMNSIPYIDFNQKHIYKRTEKIPAIYQDYIETFGKPYVIGEFGYRWEDDDPSYGEKWDFDYKRGLWYGLFHPTPILPMSWWWELFDDRRMTPYLQSVREINDLMIQSGKGTFQPVKVQSGLIESYAVRCGSTYFIYLLNNSESTVTSHVVFEIEKGKYKLQSFDPASRIYKKESLQQAKQEAQVLSVSLKSKKELVLIASQR